MIVADLLKKNLFPDFQIIAGSAGMGREITAVTVLEAPDADRWRRGGEFMVGNGFVFKGRSGQLTGLLRRMNDKGGASGFKLDRFHTGRRRHTEEADGMQIPSRRYRCTTGGPASRLIHTVLSTSA